MLGNPSPAGTKRIGRWNSKRRIRMRQLALRRPFVPAGVAMLMLACGTVEAPTPATGQAGASGQDASSKATGGSAGRAGGSSGTGGATGGSAGSGLTGGKGGGGVDGGTS